MVDIRHCYDILDVPIEASVDDINRQHKDLVNIWHPDRFVSNPRLQKKAEQRLAEINAAYDTLINFIQAQQPAPAANDQASQHQNAEEENVNESTTTDASTDSKQPFMPGKRWAKGKPKRSLRWNLFRLSLIALLVSLLLIIPQIRAKLPFLDDPVGYLGTTVKDAIHEIMGGSSQTNSPPVEVPAKNSTVKRSTAHLNKPYVEICLKGGSVIRAVSYRIEDDMLVYQLDHGSIGIPRSRVKSIRVIKIEPE